jgi:hypothetical protein
MRAKLSPTIKTLQIAGGALFLVSFALHSIRVDSDDIFRGYQCADLAARFLYLAIREVLPHAARGLFPWLLNLCFGLSGLINPLLLCYLLVPCKLGRRIASLICILFIETWCGLAYSRFVPLVGHFLWVAGTLLLLTPEISVWQENLAKKSNTQ